MNLRLVSGVFLAGAVAAALYAGCGKKAPPKQVLVKINDYEISLDEFEYGLKRSPNAEQSAIESVRRKYLDELIGQKLVLLDAQEQKLDRDPEFLRAVELYWEQSLVALAIGRRARDISASVRVPEEHIHQLYSQMIKDGVTNKSYDDVYPQIKWQAEKQAEAQALYEWRDRLRKKAVINVDNGLFMSVK